MKTLATIFALVVLTIGTSADKKATNASSEKVIAHETYAVPAEFGFGNNYYLDVDKDGMSDYLFTTLFVNEEDGIHTKYIVNAIGENEVLSVGNDAAIADAGNPVESFGNISWVNSPAYILEQVDNGTSSEWKGLWSGDRDQYIGIRLVKNGKSYTGWVKINIDQATEKAQVQGYAINRVAENMINAGEI